jgi:hypothetical protein
MFSYDKLTNELIHFMEQSYTPEVNIYSVSEEIRSILCNRNFNYVSITSHSWYGFWARLLQSTPSNYTSLRSVTHFLKMFLFFLLLHILLIHSFFISIIIIIIIIMK